MKSEKEIEFAAFRELCGFVRAAAIMQRTEQLIQLEKEMMVYGANEESNWYGDELAKDIQTFILPSRDKNIRKMRILAAIEWQLWNQTSGDCVAILQRRGWRVATLRI